MPRLRSALVVLLLSASAACGSGSDERSTATPGGSSSSVASSASGTILTPGPPPPAWTAASGPRVALTTPPEGKDFASVPCPTEFRPQIGGTSQCVVYADAGGAFALVSTTTDAGIERTALLCQVASGTEFEPALSIEAPKAASAGAVDGEGQQLVALALVLEDGTHWFGIRSPEGAQCPAIWDLGVAAESVSTVSSVGGVTLFLAAGPLCVRLNTEGLLTREGRADGVCD